MKPSRMATDEPPELPPRPKLPVDRNEHEQAFEGDEDHPDDQRMTSMVLPYAEEGIRMTFRACAGEA